MTNNDTDHDTTNATAATSTAETQSRGVTPAAEDLRALVAAWRHRADTSGNKLERDDYLNVAYELEQRLNGPRPAEGWPESPRSPYASTPWAREHQAIEGLALEPLAASWVEYAENSGVDGEAAEAYRACARQLEEVVGQPAHLVASGLRVEDDLRLASDEGENHATPVGVAGWYAEVNLGEIHPRRASQLLRHVAIARPGGSECDQLLLSLSRQLAETARAADRDNPDEAEPPWPDPTPPVVWDFASPKLRRIEVGPPYTERKITIDPETGIQIPLEHGGILHMPPAGSYHTDLNPEVCRLHPFVETLRGHVQGTYEDRYELAVWLHGAGNDALQAFLAAPMAVDQEPDKA